MEPFPIPSVFKKLKLGCCRCKIKTMSSLINSKPFLPNLQSFLKVFLTLFRFEFFLTLFCQAELNFEELKFFLNLNYKIVKFQSLWFVPSLHIFVYKTKCLRLEFLLRRYSVTSNKITKIINDFICC